ncbi:MAG TPA: methylmalonyl-CoA mutase family protein [Algoriphagus sp.]|nr:methylmalonyl-CoA mutase family protein [Algoriphagus sp.]
MISTIFSEFSPSNKEAWKNQAFRDLKGKDFDQSLKSLLWDKIEIEPFYTQEDLIGLSKLPELSFENDTTEPDFSPRNWVNFAGVFPGSSNKEILNFLQNGANGLILHLKVDENLDEKLKGVQPEFISILVKPLGDPVLVLEEFLDWVRKTGLDAMKLTGAFLWSPMDLLFDEGKSWEEALATFRKVIVIVKDFQNFHPFAFQFGRYADSGASGLDELIFGFGEIIDLIGHSGIEPEKILRKGVFYSSVAESHFPEISKLKAMRFFAAELAFQYGVNLNPADITVFVKTSDWSKSILDPNNNLIRQTYEAMAAVFGGVNGLWVKPLQEEKASDLELRIARNVSSILVHESYLDKVPDPAAGSYYLDKLISQIMDQIKSGLQDLEEKGGWLAAFNSRELHSQVRESRLNQQNAVLSGKISKIGANKYPASDRVKNSLGVSLIEEKDFELKPSRASYLVELQHRKEA